MPFLLDDIQDDARYTAKEIAEKVDRDILTIRIHTKTRLPDEFRIDQNKGWKYRKYLVSGKGVKFLYWQLK